MRSTIFWAAFERSLGATAIRAFERRVRSAARSRAEAAASAIAPAAAFGQTGSPGFGRRPALGDRRSDPESECQRGIAACWSRMREGRIKVINPPRLNAEKGLAFGSKESVCRDAAARK
jgi:hypothetical protein